MSRLLQVRMTPSQYEAIENEAKRLKISVVDVARRALDQYFTKGR